MTTQVPGLTYDPSRDWQLRLRREEYQMLVLAAVLNDVIASIRALAAHADTDAVAIAERAAEKLTAASLTAPARRPPLAAKRD
jgi:hypothetical protein